MLVTISFILGLLIGSFLNVCIYRIPREESIVFPPSHCTACNHRIAWYDLLPLFGFILLKGKCRHCGEKISIKYPLIELFTAFIFALICYKYGYSFEALKYIVLVPWIIVIGIIDLDTTDIYFKTTASGVIAGLSMIALGYLNGLAVVDFLLGGVVGAGVIALIVVITGGMGWGDVEVFLICGLFLGLKLTVLALLLSFIIGGMIGVLLIVTKKKSRKDYIPFAPFIVIATIFSIFLGENLINFYLMLH